MPTDHSTGWAPQWPVSGVGAWMSHRLGGCSPTPFDSLNLGAAVGDDPNAVLANRSRFQAALQGAVPVFMRQVHGVNVVRLGLGDLRHTQDLTLPHEADGAVTNELGIACTVQVADCLPVLFAAPQGRAVGAAHAGWRGLAAGVLEATLREICALAACEPAEVQAWMGPCIGPRQFEVGQDVRDAFSQAPDEYFVAQAMGHRYMADLPALARWRLGHAGVSSAQVHGGTWCTVENPSRFFSFRRDRVTGRQAAAIWRLA
jgi:YfiH family protein